MDYNVIPPPPNFFNTKRNNIHSTKDKSTTNWLETLFARGLCWTLEKAASRRPDFPSWSWAGWIGPTAQFPWQALSLSPIDSEIDIRFRRSNGTFENMSETLIAEVDRQGLSPACFTQILRIRAWASEVSFEYFPLGIKGQKPHVRGDGSERRYYTTFEFSATSSESGKPTYGYWPLTLTTEVIEGDNFHNLLCQGKFICLWLSEDTSSLTSFGLVVRQNGNFAERIGSIEGVWWHE